MIPIDPEASPSALVELIYRLKIKDIMTTSVRTASPDTPLRGVQHLMRENKISGVPIVDGERLVGLVSVDDIIRALDQGYIDSPCALHMSRKVVVLEDDMPVSFGISRFEKYRYGRFPVLNREKVLVGIVTSRDITSGLLPELNRTLLELEAVLNRQAAPTPAGTVHRVFVVRQFDYENAGRASTELKRLLQERGVGRAHQRRAAIASFELEMNLVNHSWGGQLSFRIDPEQVAIEARDRGPGIENLDLALTEGYSTANDWIRSLGFGAGMGLPNTRRNTDEFDLSSQVGTGTQVRCVVRWGAAP